MNTRVLRETMRAYADCWSMEVGGSFDQSQHLRSLNFRASEAVSRDEAQEIMEIAVPGYNEFDPSLIGLLPPGCRVTLAREASVCIYVTPHPCMTDNRMKADKCHQRNGETRIWWD